MKKITLFILGIFLFSTASLFAGDVQNIDPNAWLDHTSKMQVLRENIMALISKKMTTQSDKDELSSLRSSFEAEQNSWQNYLSQVASNKDVKGNYSQYNYGKSNLCKPGYKCPQCTSNKMSAKSMKCSNCDGNCKAKMWNHGCKCQQCTGNKMSAKSMKCANCDGNCKAKMCKPACKCPNCMKN